ncbi:IucA/IucC family protein [Staphylococcus aureus]
MLRQHPQYMQYSEQGLIKDLGVSGYLVYPTSSVRTVFSKALNIYLKLPITYVKITNLSYQLTLNRLNGQLMPRKLSHQSKMRLKHPDSNDV